VYNYGCIYKHISDVSAGVSFKTWLIIVNLESGENWQIIG
jgi:hypothetical protein